MNKLLRKRIKKDTLIRKQNDARTIRRVTPKTKVITFINKIKFRNTFPWRLR